jgi:pimeloyl-ACP methyl ester carboxylesterase
MTDMADTIRQAGRVDVGGVRLHVTEAGDPKGPLVVLLHGFPGFGESWRTQIDALSNGGFHVLAPDLRGFHLSDKPESWRAYRLEALAADVAGLVQTYKARDAVIVGHDWGGAVAWAFAEFYPDRLRRLVILNVPHPKRSVEDGLRSIDQLRRSWYFFFFQLPRLPEWWLSRHGFRNLRRWMEREALSASDIDRYIAAATAGGDSLRGGVNYYRAFMRQVAARALPRFRPIESPTLIIWGAKDSFIREDMADPGSDIAPRRRLEVLPDAAHWVHHDAPDRVNGMLLDFARDR